MMKADIIVGLRYGDEGKGKVTHHLLKDGDYTHCIRFNGGGNAGHTIYHNGQKFVTHLIPAGVFFGVKSIIGNGCVVNIEKFQEEIDMLNKGGVETEGMVFVANNAHIVLDSHVEEDSKDKKIGTTKTGNGPAYRNKYDRKGMTAKEAFIGTEYEKYLVDLYEELHCQEYPATVLCEGAQGFGLDIDWGDYPYVTSSHCTTAGALLNAIPPQAVRHVFGIAKAYDTYVGTKEFHGKDEIFNKIQELGQEYGATTGRKRQCNWLNLDDLKKAAQINGTTHVVLNKVDILKELEEFTLVENNQVTKFDNENAWKNKIKSTLPAFRVIFSESPEKV